MKILIADDNPKYYNELRATLKRERPDDELVFASDALIAFSKLRNAVKQNHPFDLMILDEKMGGGDKDGTELLRRLRDESIGTLPIIVFITAFYNDLPADKIASSGIPISFILDKLSPSNEILLRAVLLIAREDGNRLKYHPKDIFGERFIRQILFEVDQILNTPHPGYIALDQQQRIGALIRSYFTTLNMRKNWDADDVLELTVFLGEGLGRIFNLPDELIDMVRRFLNVEEVLYTIPRYRDHFFHQIKVFLLGFCILNSLNRNGRLYGTLLSSEKGIKVWFITSVFHDIGYPFEKIKAWLNHYISGVLQSPADTSLDDLIVPMEFHWGALFGRRYHWSHLQNIANTLCKTYSDNQPSKISELITKLAHYVAQKPDHGLYSSLILQNFLRLRLDDEEVDPISTAVALHNYEVSKIVRGVFGGHLSFDVDSLSFLLAYCDIAQDWGRSRLLSRGPKLDSIYGYNVFDNKNANLYQTLPNNNCEICIELRYVYPFSEIEAIDWREKVYEKYLASVTNIWRSARQGSGQVCFSIKYFQGESNNNRQHLDTLSF